MLNCPIWSPDAPANRKVPLLAGAHLPAPVPRELAPRFRFPRPLPAVLDLFSFFSSSSSFRHEGRGQSAPLASNLFISPQVSTESGPWTVSRPGAETSPRICGHRAQHIVGAQGRFVALKPRVPGSWAAWDDGRPGAENSGVVSSHVPPPGGVREACEVQRAQAGPERHRARLQPK